MRQKAKDERLAFPIAIDNATKNWQAWGNRFWPSVYLVDKKGQVRYWWYGELEWQGAPGGKFFEQKIEELLAEEK